MRVLFVLCVFFGNLAFPQSVDGVLEERKHAERIGPGNALRWGAGFAGGDEAAHDLADAVVEAAGEMAGTGAEEAAPHAEGGEGEGAEVVEGAVFAVVGEGDEDVAEDVVDEKTGLPDGGHVPLADGGFEVQGESDGEGVGTQVEGCQGGGGVAFGGRGYGGALDAEVGGEAVGEVEEVGEFVVEEAEGEVFVPVREVASGAVQEVGLDGGNGNHLGQSGW